MSATTQEQQQDVAYDGEFLVTPFNLKQRLEEFERGYLQNVLQFTQWDTRETSQLLGIPQETLLDKMGRYHLQH